jgi:hypothetical protein
VATLVLRNIDLDPVAEAEQPLGASPVPDQRVERAQQRRAGDPPRRAGLAVQVGRYSPALDEHRFQHSGVHQFRDRLPAALWPKPVVVTKVGLGGNAQRGAGPGDQLAGALVGADAAAQHVGR